MSKEILFDKSFQPKMNAEENCLYILKIKLPMNMVKYKLFDPIGKEMDEHGISMARRFYACVDDIPSFLIRRVDFSRLDWGSDEPAVATIYCYQTIDESIFSATEYMKKHGDEIYEIKEIQHKEIILNTKQNDCSCIKKICYKVDELVMEHYFANQM